MDDGSVAREPLQSCSGWTAFVTLAGVEIKEMLLIVSSIETVLTAVEGRI